MAETIGEDEVIVAIHVRDYAGLDRVSISLSEGSDNDLSYRISTRGHDKTAAKELLKEKIRDLEQDLKDAINLIDEL